jgi:hypothetical protein
MFLPDLVGHVVSRLIKFILRSFSYVVIKVGKDLMFELGHLEILEQWNQP